MGIVTDKLSGNPMLVEIKEADLTTALQAKVNQGKVAGIITTTLPSSNIISDKVYEFAGANGATVTGGTIKDTNGSTITTLQNGDSLWYNPTTTFWYRIPFQSPANYITKSSGIPLNTKGVNLFNPNDTDVVDGYYVSQNTGNLVANATYLVTGYIEVSEGMKLISSDTANTQLAGYDSSKIFVTGSGAYSTIYTVPVGVKYIRWSIDKAKLSTAKIEIGTVRTAYTAYTELYNKQIPITNCNGAESLFIYNRLAIPSKLYLLGSSQNTIYHRAILERWIPDYNLLRIENSTPAFVNNRGYSRITNPVSDATVEANLYDLNFALKDAKAFATVVGALATNNGAVSNLVIGDSYTYDGNFLKQIRTVCPDLTNIGIRKPTNDASSFCEGRGGWSLANYFGIGANDIKGTTTESHTPFMHTDTGRYFGNIEFWKLYAGGASPSGYGVAGFRAIADAIGFDSNGYKTSPQVDDIMYDNVAASYIKWDGSSWVNVSAPTFSFSFAKYRSTWGVSAPNFVTILLGLNDFRNLSLSTIAGSGSTSYSTWKTRLDSLITSVHADSPTSKIIIGLPQSDCGQEVNATGQFVKKQNASMWDIRRRIIADYDNLEANLIYIADTGSAVDPDFGWDTITEVPFANYGGSSVRTLQTGEPHPNSYAYKEIGNRIAAVIQSIR